MAFFVAVRGRCAVAARAAYGASAAAMEEGSKVNWPIPALCENGKADA